MCFFYSKITFYAPSLLSWKCDNVLIRNVVLNPEKRYQCSYENTNKITVKVFYNY